MAKVVLLIMTDGRDYIWETSKSWANFSRYDHIVINDDSGNEGFARRLSREFPSASIVSSGKRSGFDGAVRNAWRALRDIDADYILWCEDDFVINEYIDVDDMIFVLEQDPNMQQLVLMRQPWNEQEVAAGSIISVDPQDFVEWHDEYGHGWLQHRKYFSTNVNLHRKSLLDREWPVGQHSEGRFSIELFKDPEAHVAIWGRRSDPPKITHIGHNRTGFSY